MGRRKAVVEAGRPVGRRPPDWLLDRTAPVPWDVLAAAAADGVPVVDRDDGWARWRNHALAGRWWLDRHGYPASDFFALVRPASARACGLRLAGAYPRSLVVELERRAGGRLS